MLLTLRILVGVATYYDAGIAEQVLANRLAWGHVQPCAECVGYVALLNRETVGELVWLQRNGENIEGPFLTIDCAGLAHREALIRRGWVVDVDWQTAQRWEMRGPLVDVRVYFDPPLPPEPPPGRYMDMQRWGR